MKFSNEDDRQRVVQAVLNNFGSYEGFMERLNELQSIYCGPSTVSTAVTTVIDHPSNGIGS